MARNYKQIPIEGGLQTDKYIHVYSFHTTTFQNDNTKMTKRVKWLLTAAILKSQVL